MFVGASHLPGCLRNPECSCYKDTSRTDLPDRTASFHQQDAWAEPAS